MEMLTAMVIFIICITAHNITSILMIFIILNHHGFSSHLHEHIQLITCHPHNPARPQPERAGPGTERSFCTQLS